MPIRQNDWQDHPNIFLRNSGLFFPEVYRVNGNLSSGTFQYSNLDLPGMPVGQFSFLARPSAGPKGWNQSNYQKLLAYIQPNFLVNRDGDLFEEIPVATANGTMSTSAFFRKRGMINMEDYGFPKPNPVIVPPVKPNPDVREPWMNSYSTNGNWVTVDQLRWQPYTGMEPKTVGRSNERVGDTPTTNVSSSHFLRPLQNGYTWPQLIVRPSDLHPNPHKAKFDRNVWVVISNFGGQYVGTYP